MKILADNNIAFVREAFAELGEVSAVPAPELTPERVRDADILLTRSTVKLGAPLLQGSRVRFVATATSGVDHVDQPWLAQQGVGFASAHGSNANAVAEWFVITLLTMTEWRPHGPAGLTVGVVGVGAVGSIVARYAEALGCQVLRCDPPLERAGGEGFVSLQEVLDQCDVLTTHTPLTRDGLDPTWHLIDAAALDRLKPGALVLNASRGEVVDGDALLERVATGRLTAALDVLEDEPACRPHHIAAAHIVSPHVAGHSLDAKVNGTRMVYEAACAHLGVAATWDPASVLPSARPWSLDAASMPLHRAVLKAARFFHTLDPDDVFLRALSVMAPDDARGRAFRQYRRSYRVRREFHTAAGHLLHATPALTRTLSGLGFELNSN